MLAAAVDVAGELSLLIGHLANQAVLEDLGAADDRIQRCPQLV
jgi:hypothetical protein